MRDGRDFIIYRDYIHHYIHDKPWGSEMFEAKVSNVGLTNDSKVGANNSSNLAKFMGFINQLRTGGPHCSI